MYVIEDVCFVVLDVSEYFEDGVWDMVKLVFDDVDLFFMKFNYVSNEVIDKGNVFFVESDFDICEGVFGKLNVICNVFIFNEEEKRYYEVEEVFCSY